MIEDAPVFHQKMRAEDFRKKFPAFAAYTDIWTLDTDDREVKDMRVSQVVSTDYNSFFLLDNG